MLAKKVYHYHFSTHMLLACYILIFYSLHLYTVKRFYHLLFINCNVIFWNARTRWTASLDSDLKLAVKLLNLLLLFWFLFLLHGERFTWSSLAYQLLDSLNKTPNLPVQHELCWRCITTCFWFLILTPGHDCYDISRL